MQKKQQKMQRKVALNLKIIDKSKFLENIGNEGRYWEKTEQRKEKEKRELK